MTDEIKPEKSLTEELFSDLNLLEHCSKKSNLEIGPRTPYEVFRNNTTAVEVIVKEVANRNKKMSVAPNSKDAIIKTLQEDVDKLKIELNKANTCLEKTKNSFGAILCEIKKQLHVANQRELDTQMKNITLQMENEKLNTLLDCKSKLVGKLKKELTNLRRILKFIIKGVASAPQVPEIFSFSSDPEYDEFENYLKKDIKVKFATSVFDGTATFDSTMSKEIKTTIEKHYC